jgi:aminoglycoside 6'-N-acetyltransferase I
MSVRLYRPDDFYEWLRMRTTLWPDSDAPEARLWLAREDAAVIVADREGTLIGFAEAGERAYADGCDTSPVAYLEGLYVDPQHRHQNIARSLVHAVEQWAKQRGLTEFASDCLLENNDSYRTHLAIGFEEVERSIKFRKAL